MNPKPEEIKAARAQLGITQREAAAMLPVIRVTWARWECGMLPMPEMYWRLWRHLAGIERIPFRPAKAEPRKVNRTKQVSARRA